MNPPAKKPKVSDEVPEPVSHRNDSTILKIDDKVQLFSVEYP
jgi:hypothetical protein